VSSSNAVSGTAFSCWSGFSFFMCFLDAKKFKVGKLTDLRGVSNPDMGEVGKFQEFEISNRQFVID
jgi:hypothetical protein